MSARALPELKSHQYKAGERDDCLSGAQIGAFARELDGARDRSGRALYASFPWDSAIAAPGWRVWKIGFTAESPALNIVRRAGSLASVFSTPSTALPPAPQALLAFQMAFDFNSHASTIYRTTALFRQSAWQDIGMRSTGLSVIRDHGGKLIVPQGVSDPVFSITNTLG